MAATVVGSRKRGLTAFLDDPFSPFQPHLAKRGRCLPSAAAVADLGLSLEFDPIDALQLIFPDADPQVLQDYFEASGNILDAAIRGFKDYLTSGSTEPRSATINADMVSSEDIPTNCSEWAELVVKEISSASDLIDAKNRAFRILELFEKSTADGSSADATQKMREEH